MRFVFREVSWVRRDFRIPKQIWQKNLVWVPGNTFFQLRPNDYNNLLLFFWSYVTTTTNNLKCESLLCPDITSKTWCHPISWCRKTRSVIWSKNLRFIFSSCTPWKQQPNSWSRISPFSDKLVRKFAPIRLFLSYSIILAIYNFFLCFNLIFSPVFFPTLPILLSLLIMCTTIFT